MINNSALSSTMNVADLVPKAATRQPERSGDNAFSEALAGAHSVHDRRESQAAGTDAARRTSAQGDRSTERTRGQDRAGETRSDRSDAAGRAERRARTGNDADTTTREVDAPTDEPTDATRDASAPTATDDTDGTPTASTEVQADTEADAPDTAAQATVAVAAAPVVTDLDAIIVPTAGTVTQVTTDTVDAAIKLAIAPTATATTTAAATATVDVDAAPLATATPAVDVEVDVAAAAATTAPATEDAEAGDALLGPTRPSTSMQATTSGPSPVQLAAATFTSDEATPTAAVAQVAVSDAVDVAAGTTTDAAATQLVQAAVVEADADTDADVAVATTDAADAAVDVDADAATVAKATKADAAATKVAADAEPEVVEADVPEAVQAARLNQAQAQTVAVNAQAQAKAAAEQAAEEGADSAAPAKLEPLPAQAAPVATSARADGAAAALRMREGLQAQVQDRIDHIAEQLATRLRLSQAAGGSQVQLSLKPRELGEVTVQMNVREGAVAATILVDKADTLRTLQTNIEDLKRSLEQQGLAIEEFSVDVRGDSGAGGANARAAADLRTGGAGSPSSSSSSLAGAAGATPGLTGDREVVPEDVHDGDVSVLA